MLTVTQMLRAKGVVGRFVEFYGPGLDSLSLADRATIANMAPEYGATCGFFPIDERTIEYLRLTGRDEDRIELVEAYAKAQGLWRDAAAPEPVFTDTLDLDMSDDRAVARRAQAAAGPGAAVATSTTSSTTSSRTPTRSTNDPRVAVEGEEFDLGNGDVVIAAITSCTNTSNPSVLIAAGLVARKARAKGLQQAVGQDQPRAGKQGGHRLSSTKAGSSDDLDALGFDLVGYGCTTCIGNSGPLAEPISKAINDNDLVAVSVLSGNRNFEGRVSPDCRANYLASPPLVVAYALKGTVRSDMINEPIGTATQRRAGVPQGHLADQ